jgi:hypothetical protein
MVLHMGLHKALIDLCIVYKYLALKLWPGKSLRAHKWQCMLCMAFTCNRKT